MHTKFKSSTMEPRSQDTFTSVYGAQFPSTTTSVDISPPRYSFIACACACMNKLNTPKCPKVNLKNSKIQTPSNHVEYATDIFVSRSSQLSSWKRGNLRNSAGPSKPGMWHRGDSTGNPNISKWNDKLIIENNYNCVFTEHHFQNFTRS